MPIDTRSDSDPLRRRLRRLSRSERREEAVHFIRLYYRENGLPDADRIKREREVVRSLRLERTYEHTPEELVYGARVAWRNHPRCIGRLYWNSLTVLDRRHVSDPDEIAGDIAEHMQMAFGDGRIRSIISVFAPINDDFTPIFIEGEQILQYAGYQQASGEILGDPKNLEFTRIVMSLGWRPPDAPGMFDILPIILRRSGGARLRYELPPRATRQIEIVHPETPQFAELGLRWYAVPCVSNMILTIGGIEYPCAPFNGFYMCTEIASRNLADRNRYDLLERIADVLGYRRNDSLSLWKDRALLELNRAVLYSFEKEGVTIVDHHSASDQYVSFVNREQAAGRIPSGEWSWIVPPQASSACPVFHLEMGDQHAVPNFYRSRAVDGSMLRHRYDDEVRSPMVRRLERLRRRARRYLSNRA